MLLISFFFFPLFKAKHCLICWPIYCNTNDERKCLNAEQFKVHIFSFLLLKLKSICVKNTKLYSFVLPPLFRPRTKAKIENELIFFFDRLSVITTKPNAYNFHHKYDVNSTIYSHIIYNVA